MISVFLYFCAVYEKCVLPNSICKAFWICFRLKVKLMLKTNLWMCNYHTESTYFIHIHMYRIYLFGFTQHLWIITLTVRYGFWSCISWFGYCLSKKSCPIFIVTYYIKWVNTSWTYSINVISGSIFFRESDPDLVFYIFFLYCLI